MCMPKPKSLPDASPQVKAHSSETKTGSETKCYMKFSHFMMHQNVHGAFKDTPMKGVKGVEYLVFKKESDATKYPISVSRIGAIYIC